MALAMRDLKGIGLGQHCPTLKKNRNKCGTEIRMSPHLSSLDGKKTKKCFKYLTLQFIHHLNGFLFKNDYLKVA